MFVSLFVVCAACAERVRTVTTIEERGCAADLACEDRDPATMDRCDLATGFCKHERVVERVVERGCETMRDCDDHDAVTVDACVNRVCHHVIDRTAAFDPASPERQNAAFLCEEPLPRCMESPGPKFDLDPVIRCSQAFQRELWNENGYLFWVRLLDLGGLARARIRPQLRVGRPDDIYTVSLRMNDVRSEPIFVRRMTVQEIGRGIEIDLGTERMPGLRDFVTAYFWFQPSDETMSRTIQWALPERGVEDASEGGRPLGGCLTVGRFTQVPAHGFLRLQESARGPQCVGRLRIVDRGLTVTMANGIAVPIMRTESDPTLFYYNPFLPRGEAVDFRTMGEFVDWIHPETACAFSTVVADGFREGLPTRHRSLGVRPGVSVVWRDASGLVHHGTAERNFALQDRGTGYPSYRSFGSCTRYNPLPRFGEFRCSLDVTDVLGSYRTVMTMENAPIRTALIESPDDYFSE